MYEATKNTFLKTWYLILVWYYIYIIFKIDFSSSCWTHWFIITPKIKILNSIRTLAAQPAQVLADQRYVRQIMMTVLMNQQVLGAVRGSHLNGHESGAVQEVSPAVSHLSTRSLATRAPPPVSSNFITTVSLPFYTYCHIVLFCSTQGKHCRWSCDQSLRLLEQI